MRIEVLEGKKRKRKNIRDDRYGGVSAAFWFPVQCRIIGALINAFDARAQHPVAMLCYVPYGVT